MKQLMLTLAAAIVLTGCNLFDGSSNKNDQAAPAPTPAPAAGDFQSLIAKLFDVDNPLAAEPVDISELEISGTDFGQELFDDFLNRSE